MRSSGYVFLDSLGRGFLRVFRGIYQFLRVFFGTRTRFSDLLQGAEFKASSLEDLRETEVFVFASLAAVHNAIDFMSKSGEIQVYKDREYVTEISGLSFAGGTLLGAGGVTAANLLRASNLDSGEDLEEFDFNSDMADLDGDLEFEGMPAEGFEI